MTAPLEARRRALVGSLLELIDADTWLWAHARYDPDQQDPVWFTLLDGGWRDDAERALAMESINHPSMVRELFARVDKSRHTTITRRQFSPPESWDQDAYRRRFSSTTSIHDTVLSFYPVGDRVLSAIGLNRRGSKPPFGARELTIAHLVLGQIPWLHRAPANVEGNTDDLLNLPRRQREVLVHLLCGSPAKEIADRLGISVHTISDYTKLLYRRFRVRSRPELLRKFMSGAVLGELPNRQNPT
jgi:DNA-binding CsgD family transcriptional regulator